MIIIHHRIWILGIFLALINGVTPATLPAQDLDTVKQEVAELREQNKLLQQQLLQQQSMIDQLSRKFSDLQKTNELQAEDVRLLKDSADNNGPAPDKKSGFSLGNVVISGEGAAGFFETGKNGSYPNASFRVDEARLFVDAPVWEDAYFYGEVDLQTREESASSPSVQLGEIYLQWEDLSKYLGAEGLLNARIGQFYTPFGEEYERRYAFENPLISHSLSDLWGLNPGVELYGAAGAVNYAVAVQNGGISNLSEGTADKSVAGRVGYSPRPWLALSVSGMRTGQLSVKNDGLSAMWFGNSFFQSIGSAKTTDFQVNLAEFDADATWKSGDVRAAAGYANYEDNDPLGRNSRDLYYYYVEALQHLAPKLYAVARWSQIRSPKGYVLAGDAANYDALATDLWRLSLGLGYQFNSHLEIKAEYMFENGSLITGGSRDHENMVATEAAFKF